MYAIAFLLALNAAFLGVITYSVTSWRKEWRERNK
jgi:hypothetical protein